MSRGEKRPAWTAFHRWYSRFADNPLLSPSSSPSSSSPSSSSLPPLLPIRGRTIRLQEAGLKLIASDGVQLPPAHWDEVGPAIATGLDRYDYGDSFAYDPEKEREERLEHVERKSHANVAGDDSDAESSGRDASTWEDTPELRKLVDDIDDAILELGGAVFPKTPWHSLQDAAWMAPTGTLRCENAAEVLLLLQASDAAAEDYGSEHCLSEGNDILVLKRWYDLKPSMEFRCFVKERRLIGVSQRHITAFFDFLSREQDELLPAIVRFFDNNFAQASSWPCPQESCTIDVYLTPKSKTVRILDFGSFGAASDADALLFTWEELEDVDVSRPVPAVIRVIHGQNSIVSDGKASATRVPFEVLEASRGAGQGYTAAELISIVRDANSEV